MLEFTNLVYLDYQKTGTTSIAQFLRSVLADKEVEHGAHNLPVGAHDTTKFHFISVRNPLSMYVSLFSHGAGGLGGLRKTLEKAGRIDLYEPSTQGFLRWLEFMLDESNAANIFRKYNRFEVRRICGPLSYRLLMLSVLDALKSMSDLPASKDDVSALFNKRRLYHNYVRTEHLVADLFALWPDLKSRCRVKKRYRNVEDFDGFSALIPKKNASKKIPGLSSAIIPDELRALVRAREWLIYDTFGYGDQEKGIPSPLADKPGPLAPS